MLLKHLCSDVVPVSFPMFPCPFCPYVIDDHHVVCGQVRLCARPFKASGKNDARACRQSQAGHGLGLKGVERYCDLKTNRGRCFPVLG